MNLYLVFIKSYRDNQVDIEQLTEIGKVFTDQSRAMEYRDELEKQCSGWLQAEMIEFIDA